MPYNTIIDRTGASALIPTEYANQIVKSAVQQSAALQLCRRISMGSSQQRMPVLSVLPESYWVSGDTGLKQTTSMAWEGIFLNVEELASITPVPEAVIDDSSFDVWGELQAAISQSLSQKIDAAIFSGVEKPATWPQSLVAGATAAGNVVTADSPAAEGGMLNDLANLLAVVEADGYEPSGIGASRAMKPLLRATRSTTGEALLGAQTLDNVWSTPVSYAVAGTMGTSLAVAGDFANCAVIGIRQDVTYKILDQASIVDGTGKVIMALAQQDSVALRVVLRLAFAVGIPATLIDQVSGPAYPFAVLNPGTTTRSQGQARSAKK